MRYLVLALAVALLFLTSVAAADQQPPPAPNPNIDMEGYLKVAAEAAKHRVTHRLTEDDFLKMSQEPATIVLDARSKQMYDLLHVKWAINLSFPNIDVASLKKALPDKNARILIYCNNNFKGAPVAFATKAPIASLNISTYISLYSYGYQNVYELGPQVDVKESKLPWAGKQVDDRK